MYSGNIYIKSSKGYLTTEVKNAEIHYIFLESMNNPSKDVKYL